MGYTVVSHCNTVSYKNGMSVNTIYIVGYIINDVLVSDGQFTIVNVGTN